MTNSKLRFYSLLNAVAVVVYTSLVATLLFNGQKLFGTANSVLAPIAMLLLFVLSATIVGLLVFGHPIYLYINNEKTGAIKLLFYTVGWLIILTLIFFLVLLKMK